MESAEHTHQTLESLPRYPHDPDQDRQTVAAIIKVQRHERWQRVRHAARRIGSAALIGAVIATGDAYAYMQRDINIGKAEIAGSHPVIHDIFINPDPEKATTATYVATGMGTRDSSETARTLTAHNDVGSTYAVEYSNKEIDIYALTDSIVDHACKHGVRYLSFDGYSAGGPIELAVAAEIHEHYDDLHVVSITMNSSPIGEGSLSEKSEEGGRILSTVLNYWPDLAYSEKARLAAEVLARKEQYYNSHTHTVDTAALEREIQSVTHEKIDNEKAASGSLITSQINFIYRYLAEKNIARLAKPRPDKQLPMIFGTFSSDPSTDHVVNNVASAHNLLAIASHHFVPLTIITIDNIAHANPAERPTEYNDTIENEINPLIESSLRVDYGIGGEPDFGEKLFLMPPRYPYGEQS